MAENKLDDLQIKNTLNKLPTRPRFYQDMKIYKWVFCKNVDKR